MVFFSITEINMDETFKAICLSLSKLSSGFKDVFLSMDHGSLPQSNPIQAEYTTVFSPNLRAETASLFRSSDSFGRLFFTVGYIIV